MGSTKYSIATVSGKDLQLFLDTANAWLKKNDYAYRLRGQADQHGQFANIYTYSIGANPRRVNVERTSASKLRAFLASKSRFGKDYVWDVWHSRFPHNIDLATV